MVKKISVCLLLICCLVLSACGKSTETSKVNEDLLGTWYLVNIEDTTLTPEEQTDSLYGLIMLQLLDNPAKIEFKEDGTGIFTVVDPINFTYDSNEMTIKATGNGASSNTVAISIVEQQLILNYGGSNMLFDRNPIEIPDELREELLNELNSQSELTENNEENSENNN